jgi:hypothetical protein
MKYVQLLALSNKGAATVTAAIFKHWICPFGVTLDLINSEFCAGISEDLF